MVSLLPHAAALLSLTNAYTTTLARGGHNGTAWGNDAPMEVLKTDLALGDDNLGVDEQSLLSSFSTAIDNGGFHEGIQAWGCEISTAAPSKFDFSFIQTPHATIDLRGQFFSATHAIPAEAPTQTADASVAIPSTGPRF